MNLKIKYLLFTILLPFLIQSCGSTDEGATPPVKEEPKIAEPKASEPRTVEPEIEDPKVEKPKIEDPKIEEPKEEAPFEDYTELPQSIKELYASEVHDPISDEFNGPNLDGSKWGRRATGTASIKDHFMDLELVKMESENETKFISMKGTSENNIIRTAGIVTKSSGFYGFYVARFRLQGFKTPEVIEKGTIWHPSIWSARTDSRGLAITTAPKDYWVEIDFLEWENGKAGWSSDAPARLLDSKGVTRKVDTRPGKEKAIMKDLVTEGFDKWGVIALEYNPSYLKLWKYENNKWEVISDRDVNFITHNDAVPEEAYTLTTIGERSRQPCFWLLGNIVPGFIESNMGDRSQGDVSIDIDFFRYYPEINWVDRDWRQK